MGLKNDQLLYVESISKQELIIPTESSKMETIPLDRVRQPRVNKFFKFEMIYLSEHLKKLKENFIRNFYPRNKLQRNRISYEHQSSQVLKFIGDEMLQRGQDTKAMMLAADVRDREVFATMCQMFERYGLKKLVKGFQNIVQDREKGSLYGGLSSKRGDTLDYFYNQNEQAMKQERRKEESQGSKVNGKYANFVESADQGFRQVYEEIKENMESEEEKIDSNKEIQEEEKENENLVKQPLKKKQVPEMNNIMESLYKKSLNSKAVKKMQY